MVFQGTINAILSIIDWVLSPLGSISFNFDISFIQPIIEFLKLIYYLLPINYLFPLFVIVFSLMSFKITISLLKTVMEILPLI